MPRYIDGTMTTSRRNHLLVVYNMKLEEQKKGGLPIEKNGAYRRLLKAVTNKIIYCYKCDYPIENDQDVITQRSIKHSKIYHKSCLVWL